MKNKILNILSVVFGLLLMNGGLAKFFPYMPPPPDLHPELVRDHAALEEILWLIPLIASAEILGGLLILFPRTRALGVLVVFPVLVGVLLTHIFVDPSQLITALVIWAMLIWIILEERRKFLGLIQNTPGSGTPRDPAAKTPGT